MWSSPWCLSFFQGTRVLSPAKPLRDEWSFCEHNQRGHCWGLPGPQNSLGLLFLGKSISSLPPRLAVECTGPSRRGEGQSAQSVSLTGPSVTCGDTLTGLGTLPWPSGR